MNLAAELAAAREHLHRSIGQRTRWALHAIRERVQLEQLAMWRSFEGWR